MTALCWVGEGSGNKGGLGGSPSSRPGARGMSWQVRGKDAELQRLGETRARAGCIPDNPGPTS